MSMRILRIALLLGFLPALAWGATCTWNGSAANGTWTDTTNWDFAAFPGPLDDVIINTTGAGTDPVLLGNYSYNSLTLTNGSLNLNGHTLTIAQAVIGAAGTSVLAPGLLQVGGNFVFSGGITFAPDIEFTGIGNVGSGADSYTFSGNLNLSAGSRSCQTAGLVMVNGYSQAAGTLFSSDTTGGRLRFNAAVIHSAGTIQAAAGLVRFNAAYDGSGGGTLTGSTVGIQFRGNVSLGTLNSVASDTIIFAGGAAQQLTSNSQVFPSISITKSGGSVQLMDNLSQNAGAGLSFTNTGATSFDLNGHQFSPGANVAVNNNTSLVVGSGTYNASSYNLDFTAATNASLSATSGTIKVVNLNHSSTGASTLGTGDLDITGTLTIGGSGSLIQSGATAGSQSIGAISVSGGSLTLGSSSLTLAGPVAVSSGTLALGGKTISGISTLTANGSGSINFGSSTQTTSGNVIVNTTGTVTAGGTLTMGGTATLNIGTTGLNDLVVNGAVTVTGSGAAPAVQSLTFTAGSLGVGSHSFQAATATVSRPVTVGAGGTFSTSGTMTVSGSITGTGSGGVTSGGLLTVNGSGSISLAGGAISVSSGGLDIAAAAGVVSTGTGTIGITGPTTVHGTLTGGTGLITCNGSLTVPAGGTMTIGSGGALVNGANTADFSGGSLDLAGAGSAALTVQGNLVFSAGTTLSATSIDSIIFTGGNAQSLTSGGKPLPSIQENKSGNGVSLQDDLAQVASATLAFGNSGASSFNLNAHQYSPSAAVSINNANTTVAVGTGTWNGAGYGLTITNGFMSLGTGAFSVAGLTVNGGSFTQTGAAAGNQTVGALTVSSGSCNWDNGPDGGDLLITGLVTSGATLNFHQKDVRIGTGLIGNITVYDLTIPAATNFAPTGGAQITVSHNLSLQNGGTYTAGGASLILGGASGSPGTISDGNLTKQNLGILVVDAYTKTMMTNIYAGSVDIRNGGILALSDFNLTSDGVVGTSSAPGSLQATLIGSAEQITIGGNLSVTTFVAGNSKVIFDSATNASTNSYSFYDLELAKNAANSLTANNNLTVTHSFVMTSGIFNAGALSHAIAGDWDSSAITFNNGGGTITLTAGSPLLRIAGVAGFGNLVLDGGAVLNSNISVAGTFTAANNGSGGLLNLSGGGGRILTVAGNVDLHPGASGATLTATGSTLSLSGVGSQTVRTNGVNWNDVTIAGAHTGIVTFYDDALNVTGTLTVNSGSYAVAINDVAGTASNLVSFLNTGGLTIAAGYTFDHGVSAIQAGTNNFQGTISTDGAASHDITLSNLTLGGNLNFNAGAAGTIVVNNAVSGGTNTLTINNSAGTTFKSTLIAGTMDLLDTTGTIEVQGNLTLTSGLTTANKAYAIKLTGGTNSIAGSTSFLNTGGVTLGATNTDSFLFSGGLSSTSAGTNNFQGSVATGGGATQDIALSNLTLGGNLSFNAGSGGTIGVTGITAGAGFDLTIANSAGATFQASLTVANFGITTTTGTIDLQGNTTISGSLTTAAVNYAVRLTGNVNSVTNAVNFINTGGLTLGNANTDTFSFTGGLRAQTVGPNNFQGSISTGGAVGQDIALSNLTLGGNVQFDSGASGIIGVTGIITGAGYNLGINQADGATFGNALNAIGTLNLATTINAASPIIFNGAVTATTLQALTGGTYNLQFNAGALITNNVSFANSGTLTLGNDVSDVFTCNGTISATTPTLVTVAGRIRTSNDTITLGNTTLATATTISSQYGSSGPGNIVISGNLNSTIATDYLVLDAGSGGIDYQGGQPTTPPHYVEVDSGASLTNGTGPVVAWDNVPMFINAPGSTIAINKESHVLDLVVYQGIVNLNGRQVRVANDAAFFGGIYDVNDPDRTFATGQFAYPNAAAVLKLSLPGTLSGGLSNGGAGGTLIVRRNFYANGAAFNTAAPWELRLTDKGRIDDLNAGSSNGIGTGAAANNFYAVAFNSSASNCTVTRWDGIAWNSTTGTEYVNAAENCVIAGSAEWITTRPSIDSARSRTIYDDMVEVVFWDGSADIAIENSYNEITRVVNQPVTANNLCFNGTPLNFRFLGVFYWDDTGAPGPFTVNGIWEPGEPGAFVTVTANTDIPAGKRLYFKTNAVATTHGAYTWNTDATGTSAGSAFSTDRSGTHQTTIVRLILQKARIFSANGKTANDNFGWDVAGAINTASAFTGTSDACRPVLVGVYAGRSNYDPGTTVAYNGHNFLHLKYSEPLNLNSLNGLSPIGAAVPAGTAAATINFRSSTNIGAMSGTTNVAIAGLGLSYPGRLVVGVRSGAINNASDADIQGINSLWRSSASSTENPGGSAGLTIFLAGYSVLNSGTLFWPGYLDSAVAANTDPATLAMTQAVANGLTDSQSNIIEPTSNTYAGKAGGVSGVTISTAIASAGFTVGAAPGQFSAAWDIGAPDILFTLGSYEIYTTTNVAGKISRFDFVMTKRIRDSSWGYGLEAPFNYSNEILGFKFGDIATLPLSYNDANQTLDYSVDILAYGGPISNPDDLYFHISINPLTHPWGTLTSMFLDYDADIVYLTDLAGNRMNSRLHMSCIERSPPNIQLSLGVVGGNRLYVQFDKPVAGVGLPGVFNIETNSLQAAFFRITDGTTIYTPSAIEVINKATIAPGRIGASSIFMTLPVTITPDMVMTMRIHSINSTDVIDKSGNAMQMTAMYPMSNMGINLVTPVYATDAIVNPIWSPSIQPLYVFDGCGSLVGEGKINLQVKKNSALSATFANYPVDLYYDVGVAAAKRAYGGNSFWSPVSIAGLISQPDLSAKLVTDPTAAPISNYVIDGNDPRFTDGSKVEFMLMVDGLPCAWAPDINDPRTIRPWSFGFNAIVAQRGNVTILNNVINPVVGDKTLLQYQVKRPGMVTIMVLTIDGNVVKVLQNGQQPASNKYLLAWDGKNQSGNIVARGMYLIRVVGPDFDEIRKVLVVKP